MESFTLGLMRGDGAPLYRQLYRHIVEEIASGGLAAGEKLGEDELCGLLGKVGLCANEYMDREMNAGLSGGEIKRIEIATVLARRFSETFLTETVQ